MEHPNFSVIFYCSGGGKVERDGGELKWEKAFLWDNFVLGHDGPTCSVLVCETKLLRAQFLYSQ